MNSPALEIQSFYATTIAEAVSFVLQVSEGTTNPIYFRGENKDHGVNAIAPSVFRERWIENEDVIYREAQRFNDHEFITDKTAFDKLARMQHYTTPTRMLDLSEDMFSSFYFALEGRAENDWGTLYVLEIDQEKIKYYDSDAVSILANLAKSPLGSDGSNAAKSKYKIWQEARNYLYNVDAYIGNDELESKRYLLHDIKEEKSYFADLINPRHLFSIYAVKPKLASQRIQSQKGAFLLFGFDFDDYTKHQPVITAANQLNPEHDYHPILKLTKIFLSPDITMEQLKIIGITKPFIYPELDKVSEHLKEIYKKLTDGF